MTLIALAGIAAAVISLIDPVPYVRDILRGATRPHRGTWLIWSALGATAFASQLADGATWSLALVGVQTVMMALILVLSIRFGMGGASAADLSLIALAGLGIAGWAISSQPVVATLFVFYVVMFSLVELPIVGYVFAGDWTSTQVGRFNTWLTNNRTKVGVWILVGGGCYLVGRGIYAAVN